MTCASTFVSRTGAAPSPPIPSSPPLCASMIPHREPPLVPSTRRRASLWLPQNAPRIRRGVGEGKRPSALDEHSVAQTEEPPPRRRPWHTPSARHRWRCPHIAVPTVRHLARCQPSLRRAQPRPSGALSSPSGRARGRTSPAAAGKASRPLLPPSVSPSETVARQRQGNEKGRRRRSLPRARGTPKGACCG